MSTTINIPELLTRLGIEPVNSGACHEEWLPTTGRELVSIAPRDGASLGAVRLANRQDLDAVLAGCHEAWQSWRMVPAPQRGEIVRQIGEELRAHKQDLGALVSLEMGKILVEGLGEVQEMIDIADFAVGLSRQLYGLTMHSERPGHRLYEQWHPLGVVACITAFNFPVAVWSWNAMLALVCGDAVLWKPSLRTPLCAIAVHKLCQRVLAKHGFADVLGLVIGDDAEVGEPLIADQRVPLVSATGSVRMGKRVSQVVAARLGRTLLELGGNNGLIIMPDANLELALPAVLFGAVGTAGQRCTTIRRLILHESIADRFTEALMKAYSQVRIGDPLDSHTLMGPLVDDIAVKAMQDGLATSR